MPSRFSNQSLIITPALFTESGAPPIVTSGDLFYSGFHVEQYIHNLRSIDLPPAAEDIIIIPLEPVQFSLRQGRRFQQGIMQEGEVVLYPRGISGHWEWQSPVNCLHLRLDWLWFQQMATQNGVGQAELIERFNLSDPRIYHIGLALLSEVKAGSPNGRIFGDSLMVALVRHLLTHYSITPVKAKGQRGGLSRTDLVRVMDYLHNNLTEDVSLDTLAGLVAVSPFHFSRLFKQSTGLPPHQFIIQERVRRAKKLLQGGELSTAEIASAVGFADAGHLSRHMKRLLGTTPHQIRKGQ